MPVTLQSVRVLVSRIAEIVSFASAPRVASFALALSTFCFSAAPPLVAQVNVLTHHNDVSRTGANTSETILTPANVNSTTFGKLFSYPVDGQLYTQPLYMANVTISGKGTHNVVFVATQHDSVYAFDADSNSGANSTPLWKITLLDAAHGAASGATTVPSTDYPTTDMTPEIGIVGTPVIDPSTGTLYVVGKTKESGAYVQRLHALDITSGAEKFGGPVALSGQVPGTGNGSVGGILTFDPFWENQRPSLLLLNGVIYIGYGAHQDLGPWHGWLLAYSASTLQQRAVYCSSPNASGAGIWLSGEALAADVVDPVNAPYGRIFLPTGNGVYSATSPYDNTMSYGDADERIDLTTLINAPTNITSTTFPQQLPVVDSFAPSNQATLDTQDKDMGAGAPIILPDQSVGGHTHLLLQVGKNGTAYLIDRDSMGGFNSSTDQIVQEVPTAVMGMWGTPAFWNNTIYIGGSFDTLKMYSFTNARLSSTWTARTAQFFNFPGATPSISANGNTNGIVWGLQNEAYSTSGPAVLFAWDATNVANQLYASNQVSPRDTAGTAIKFDVPTVSNGKVYVPTGTELDIYGLLAGAQSAATPVISPASESFNGSLSVTITDGTTGSTIYFTTDGSVPTAASTKYTGAISVTSTETINAVAIASGFAESGMASATYTLNLATAATPTFSPVGGTYTSVQSVSISDTTSGANIFYTTNGTTPTTSSTPYTGPISVSSSQTIKAIATASGFAQSAVASAAYTINLPQTATPTFSPVAGTYTAAQSVTLSDTTAGATIYYTTNGSTPTSSSTIYTGPISVSSTQTVNAIATASGFTQSPVSSALYIINTSGTLGINLSSGFTNTYPFSMNGSAKLNGTALQLTDGLAGEAGAGWYGQPLNVQSFTTDFSIQMTPGTTPQADGMAFVIQNAPAGLQALGPAGGGLGYGPDQPSGTGGIPNSMAIKFDTVNNAGETPDSTGLYTNGASPSVPFVDLTNSGITLTNTHVFKVHMIYDGTTLTMTITDATTNASFTNSWPINIPSVIGSPTAYVGFTAGTGAQTAVQSVLGWSFSGVVPSTPATYQTKVLPATSSGPSFSVFYYSGFPDLNGILFGSSKVGDNLTFSLFVPVAGNYDVKLSAKVTNSRGIGQLAVNGSNVGSPFDEYAATTAYNTLDLGTTAITTAGLQSFKFSLAGKNSSSTGTALIFDDIILTPQVNSNPPAATPTFSPIGGTYTSAQSVTLSDTTSGAAIYYTTDGSTPTTTSAVYSTPISVSSNTTIKAIAAASGFSQSAVGTAAYTINLPQAATPAFSPAAGTYTSTQSVAISDTTAGATIFYTTNGSTPTTSSTKYTAPISVSSSQTIKAIATASGFSQSSVGSAAYTINLPQAAVPTFSPAGGTYASAQSVTLGDTTAGATIYYTTNGSTPTTGSTVYTAPISVSASQTINAIAVASGLSQSSVGSASYTIGSSTASFSFSTGFAGAPLAIRGNAKLNGTALEINDGLAGEASAVWYGQPLSIANFISDFNFQMTPASTTSADGMAFVIQNSSITALGPSGGGLGYGGTTGGIPNSVAVKFDLFSNSGEGPDSTGLYTNGAAPTVPATDLSSSGIDLHSGHIFNVHMSYDGTNLSMSITDATTNAVFTTSWPINIPATVGASTAYVGFTGGTGGSAITTNVNSWSFSSALAKMPATYATSNLPNVSSGPGVGGFGFSGFPDGTGILFSSGKVGDNLSFTLNVPTAGTYDVKVSMKTTTSRGIMQLSVNGTNVGSPADTYSNTTGSYAVFDLGLVTIATPGTQTFKFTVTGKNSASSGYILCFDDITLTPQ